jgi:hypothetical protein
MTAKIALEANPGTLWIAHLLGPADALPPIEEPLAAIIETGEDGKA